LFASLCAFRAPLTGVPPRRPATFRAGGSISMVMMVDFIVCLTALNDLSIEPARRRDWNWPAILEYRIRLPTSSSMLDACSGMPCCPARHSPTPALRRGPDWKHRGGSIFTRLDAFERRPPSGMRLYLCISASRQRLCRV
jgi:hypothetical protein